MRIVVDTNIVFSTLRNSNPTRDGIFFSQDIEIFSVPRLWQELHGEKKQKKLGKNPKRHLADRQVIEEYLNKQIIIVEKPEPVYWNIAYDLCVDIDPNDIDFVALALQLHCPLWTGDQELKDGLLAKGINIFFDP
jgi:predicted nucleic acid-binding protein